jgi:hypothetical protein
LLFKVFEKAIKAFSKPLKSKKKNRCEYFFQNLEKIEVPTPN